jgi:hypothetical protein
MEHTYNIGDRVAYVESCQEPNGRVFLGTVSELIEDSTEFYVNWDDPIYDHDPWSPEALHPVGTRR